jgi:HAE1 family hydrophobic/amphiphilic exporter-1
MFLPDFCIKRPVTTIMMVMALFIFGLISSSRLGVDIFPDVDFPLVTVRTLWENARPEEMDNNITDELEDALGSISGIKHIVSNSLEGFSSILIEFELHKDVDVAAQEARDKVSTRLWKLPDEAETPTIEKLDINAQPILWLVLFGEQHSIEDLTEYADDSIRPLLQKLKGIGDVQISGGRELQVRLWLDRNKLTAHNLTVQDVILALKKQHLEVPGGKVESAEKEFLVRTMGEFLTPEAFNNLIVAYREGTTIRLRDIGYAEKGREDVKTIARYTSKEKEALQGVAIGVSARSGANKLAVCSLVKDELSGIRNLLPAGMKIEISSDDSVFIQESIDEIQFQLIIGGLMAALVIMLFLQNIRTTIFSAISIPTSIISTFTAMYILGFTMNNLTMVGLAMSVGIVIDDAIVMVENIFRHRQMGKSAMQAARDGSSEIGFAVIAATLALVCVFLPVAFMGGFVGRFFYEFAITVAMAILISAFISLTIVPMLASRFLKVSEGKWQSLLIFDRFMTSMTGVYRKLLTWSLDHRFTIVMIGILSLILGGLIFANVNKEFVTDEDKSKFVVRIETPLEYSIHKTDKALQQVEKELRTFPEVQQIFSITGYGEEGSTAQSNKAISFITMVPKDQRRKTQKKVMQEVRRKLWSIPDVLSTVSITSILGADRREEEIQYVIQGPDIETLDQYSREIMKRLEQTPGFIDVDRNLELGKPEVRVEINREKAADAGVPVEAIANAIGSLIGGVDVVEFKRGGESYDVRVRLVEQERDLPSDIKKIWVKSASGQLIELDNLVTLHQAYGPSIINRFDRQRAVTIFANLEGITLAPALVEIEKLTREVLPEGFSAQHTGRTELYYETIYNLGIAFVLAILFTYMVLGAQFESFIHPLTIMLALPLSFIGSFGLLYITGNTFNLFSMIGLVLLVGLVTKNGILLVDYANQQREKGMSIKEALIEAGSARFRPIMMTAFSTVAGVFPVALGIGVGNEMRQPMAVAIAGGLITSTLLTLLIVPVSYTYMESLRTIPIFKKLAKKVLVES